LRDAPAADRVRYLIVVVVVIVAIVIMVMTMAVIVVVILVGGLRPAVARVAVVPVLDAAEARRQTRTPIEVPRSG